MKKINFFILFTILFAGSCFISCKSDEDKEANVQFALDQTSFDVVNYAEPLQIKGTATSDKPITSLTFTGVKLENGVYVPKGDAQEYPSTGTSTINFDMEYFVDSKEITHIEIKATIGNAIKTTYISIGKVEGEANGSAFIGQVILKADTMVWNHENHPDVYPIPNTGASSSTPSFFSIQGVNINGEIKHVLSVDELRSVDGLNGSFCFVNVLQNTSNGAYISTQRGYMFTNLWKSQLGGGTTGRQCDLYEINGKAIRQENIDTTQFKIIAGSWIGSGWKEDRYKFVDSLFTVLGDEAATNSAKIRANYLLSKIQSRLDNATLGVTDNPTSLGAVNYARRRTDAGTGSTNPMTENFRTGDYIILKSQKGGKLYYGIMQIVQMYDDTQCFVNIEGVGPKIGQEEAKALFLKPLILNIKVQTALEE
ncbi:MAG: hypothetical protein KBG25_02895 [Paludibacteraceae bacterium]|nr:hypothetical protein [Paludibacteraceae bacterium]